MGKDIFISYSRKDKDLVFPLVERINRELNTPCWLDMKGIESGGDFEEKIMQNIEECRVVLFMLSDASLQSKWTKREVYYAEKKKKRIVPILIDGDELRGWFSFHFGNVDYIDIHVDEQKEKLIGDLKSWLGVQDCKGHLSDVQTNSTIPQNEGLTSPEEQFQIGKDYYYGLNGKPQDYNEAAKWYQKAAEQGYTFAQFNLGWMYRKGNGVSQNDTEAVKWYHKSAEQGYADAQTNLGWMYLKGIGVPQNDTEATKWFHKAAEQGHAQAQYNLGWMSHYGIGVPQSDTEAAKWYRKAAEQGNEDAKKRLVELGM